MADLELPGPLRDEVQLAWAHYLDLLNPFRPDLHRYCLRLTGNLWDAEDLVQDAILRGFATLGMVHRKIDNPRGYLVRIATHLWMDALRRRKLEARSPGLETGSGAPSPDLGSDVRAAGEAMLQRLSPQERAALLLKEVFDMSLDEIANMLTTSVGAVKAALHRARDRMQHVDEPAPAHRPVPSKALVESFLARLQARDLPGLLELMLDGAVIEVPGSLIESGRDNMGLRGSWLWQSVHVHPDLPEEQRPKRWEAEYAELDGEPLVLSFTDQFGPRALVSVDRFEEQDGKIARLRAYYLCPETVREVGRRLGHEVITGLYRIPRPVPPLAQSDEA